MNRVCPLEQRVSHALVQSISEIGIGYIPVPYGSEEERAVLLKQSIAKLEELAVIAEKEENNVER